MSEKLGPPPSPRHGSHVGNHHHHAYAGSTISGSTIRPPPSTNVTMTTDITPGAQVTEINLNLAYYKTLPGILKIIQLILGVFCMALSAPARGLRLTAIIKIGDTEHLHTFGNKFGVGHNHWFLLVVVTTFIITLLWAFFYFLQVKDAVRINLPFSWLNLEYYYTLVTTILYIISFIVILAGFGWCSGSHYCDARIAAGVIAIFNSFAYALGAYILHNDLLATPPELQ